MASFIHLGVAFSSFASYQVLRSFYLQRQAYRQIQLRKQRLKMPARIPWNSENIDQYLYRRVNLKGKLIQRLIMLVNRKQVQQQGYECLVPLVMSEDEQNNEKMGVIVSKGFLQKSLGEPCNNHWEDIEYEANVHGYVSEMKQLQGNLIYKGNQTNGQYSKYFGNASLQDATQVSQLKNTSIAKLAVIEMLHQQSQPFLTPNQRDYRVYSKPAQGKSTKPAIKTLNGALQLKKMPWDYSRQIKGWSLGIVAGVGTALL